MSLSSSLNSAMAGLDLTARRADIVARNVANADAPGYARRSLEGSGPAGLRGSDVSVVRGADPRMVQLRREAAWREGSASISQSFHTDLDRAIGEPGMAGGLHDSIARLDAAFISAAANPSQPSRLTEVSLAVEGVAGALNEIDRTIQESRQRADADLDRDVRRLNSDLHDVERLNIEIRRTTAGGNDVADLVDRRSVIVDRISGIIPVREVARDGGMIALVSDGGLLMLDGRPANIGFTPTTPIVPWMAVSAPLSGLTVDGRAVPVTGQQSGIRGGRLEALFAVRDDLAPEATRRVDGLAAELILRFEDPAVDGSTAPGSAGLFSDSGNPFSAAADPGLAGRIAVNPLVKSDRPDQHWRLRDGLGAASPGGGGDSRLLLRYGQALATVAAPAIVGLPDIAEDVRGHAAAIKSLFSAARVSAEDRRAYHGSISETRTTARDGAPVDIDGEMRRLLEIEQAYAANARVIQAVNDMMNKLTEL